MNLSAGSLIAIAGMWYCVLCGILSTMTGQTVDRYEMEGVLWANDGGVSGTGTGVVTISSAGEVRKLTYQKPYKTVFASEACRDPGAIWVVEVRAKTKVRGGRLPEMVSATCDGRYDDRVRSAAEFARRYFLLLGERKYRDASAMWSDSSPQSHSAQYLEWKYRGLKVSPVLEHGISCLRVADAQPESFTISVDIGCSSGTLGMPCRELDVKRTLDEGLKIIANRPGEPLH